jgi:hypothetical protein
MFCSGQFDSDRVHPCLRQTYTYGYQRAKSARNTSEVTPSLYSRLCSQGAAAARSIRLTEALLIESESKGRQCVDAAAADSKMPAPIDAPTQPSMEGVVCHAKMTAN